MSFTKFTKGPWSARQVKEPGSFELYWEVRGDFESGSGWGIVTLHPLLRAGGCSESENNARLIAAAGTAATRAEEMGYDGRAAVEALPELLEALELIASDYDFCKESPGYGDRGSAYAETAREALARAKGGKHDQR